MRLRLSWAYLELATPILASLRTDEEISNYDNETGRAGHTSGRFTGTGSSSIRLMPPYVITRGGYDVTVHTFDTGTLTAITLTSELGHTITDNKFWKPGSRGDVVTRHVLALTSEIRGRVSH